MSRLDRVPRPLRLLPGAVGGILALSSLNLIELDPVYMAIPLVGVAAALAWGARGRVRLGRVGEGEVVGPSARIFEIQYRPNGVEEAGRLVDLVRERAMASRVRYTMVSILEGGYSRSLVILSSRSSRDLVVEGEVFKTIAVSLLDGVRLREMDPEGDLGVLASATSSIPLVRGETILMPPPHLRTGATLGGGDLYLGEALDTGIPRKLYLKVSDVKGHIGVFGSTGSGKSTTMSVLASRVSGLGFRVVILDWTGEYKGLLEGIGTSYRMLDPVKGEAGINPLALLDSDEGVDVVVDILSKALGLSQPQEYMLQRILESSRPRSVEELVAVAEAYPEESKWDREVKRGLLRRLGVMVRGSGSSVFTGEGTPWLAEGITVVRCDRIRNTSLRSIYILSLLAYIYYTGPPGETLVFIDEAHNVFTQSWGGFPQQLIAESRKYGLYLALATQSPGEISNSVILNTNTKIVHSLKSGRDKAVISQALGLSQEEESMLDKLKPGEALISAPSLEKPVLARIDAGKPP